MVLAKGEGMICVICFESSNDCAKFLHCFLPVTDMSESPCLVLRSPPLPVEHVRICGYGSSREQRSKGKIRSEVIPCVSHEVDDAWCLIVIWDDILGNQVV